jgi:hypothetical protein
MSNRSVLLKKFLFDDSLNSYFISLKYVIESRKSNILLFSGKFLTFEIAYFSTGPELAFTIDWLGV